MSQAKFVLGAAAIFLVASCSHPASQQQPPQNAYSYQQNQQSSQTMMSSQQLKTCPMAVPGTEISVTNTASGIALNFTTDTGDVNDLRSRVRRAADQYRVQSNPMPGGSSGNQGQGAPGSSSNGQGTGGQPGYGPQGSMGGPPVTTPDNTGSGSSSAANPAGNTSSGGTAGGGSSSSGNGSLSRADRQMGTGGGANSSYSGQQPVLDFSQGATPPNPSGQRQASANQNVKVPYFVYAEDIDRGARLVFTPQNPGQLDTLRSEIRQHASMMQPGDCPPPRISRR